MNILVLKLVQISVDLALSSKFLHVSTVPVKTAVFVEIRTKTLSDTHVTVVQPLGSLAGTVRERTHAILTRAKVVPVLFNQVKMAVFNFLALALLELFHPYVTSIPAFQIHAVMVYVAVLCWMGLMK